MNIRIIHILTSLFLAITTISCSWNPKQSLDNWRTIYKECPDCDGDGQKRERCYACYGYQYVEQYCENCNGTGSCLRIIHTHEAITCSDCMGAGEFVCSECNGTGYVDCDTCGGDGYHTCYLCKGERIINLFGELSHCPRCRGYGEERCCMCDGSGRQGCSKTKYCRTCFGQGTKGVRPVVRHEYDECEYCGGRKTVTVRCYQCNGKGYLDSDCSTCDGEGQIAVKRTLFSL